MSELAKENSGSEPAKKSGKKLIIIAILAIVLLGAAGGGFYYWRASSVAAAENTEKNGKKPRSKKEAEPAKDEEAKADKSDKTDKSAEKSGEPDSLKDALPDDAEVTNIIELQPFIINLADTEQARYLRMTVSLGIGGAKDSKEKPDQLFMTRVRNAMLAVLSNKKSDEVLSTEGKAKLRKELLSAAQAASEEPEVHAVYITDFIVQL